MRLAARLIGLPVPHRMTGADWIWGVAALCQESGCRCTCWAPSPASAAERGRALRRWYPRLEVRGTHHGYFGLGTPALRARARAPRRAPSRTSCSWAWARPQQELWVERNHDRIDASVVWTVGALFDYVSGRVPRAPHWIADNGFEWIFRLAVEPRRMWRRYLLGNPAFLYRVMGERRRRAGRS